jgi:hypothetical protein
MLGLTLTSLASAKETIEVRKALGGSYMIMAWDSRAKTYYTLSGVLASDAHKIYVPKGFASIINVSLGKSVGARNFYQTHDLLNPILEVRKVSYYVIELKLVGYGPKTFGPSSSNEPFERKAPQ